MSISINKTEQCVEFLNTATGKLCGTYHYEDEFKSFFRGFYTPDGKDVVAFPPPEHPHHKGLQFGLTRTWQTSGKRTRPASPMSTSSQSANSTPRALTSCLPTMESVSHNKLIG